MSKILLIGKNEPLLLKCAFDLQRLGYKVLIHQDVLSKTGELLNFNVSCIVWDVQKDDSFRATKFKKLRRTHKYTPFIVLYDNKEFFGNKKGDVLFMRRNSTAEQIVHEVIDMLSIGCVLSDNDRLELLEKEYGFMD